MQIKKVVRAVMGWVLLTVLLFLVGFIAMSRHRPELLDRLIDRFAAQVEAVPRAQMYGLKDCLATRTCLRQAGEKFIVEGGVVSLRVVNANETVTYGLEVATHTLSVEITSPKGTPRIKLWDVGLTGLVGAVADPSPLSGNCSFGTGMQKRNACLQNLYRRYVEDAWEHLVPDHIKRAYEERPLTWKWFGIEVSAGRPAGRPVFLSI